MIILFFRHHVYEFHFEAIEVPFVHFSSDCRYPPYTLKS